LISEQLRAFLGDFHIGAALVHPEPVLSNGVVETGFIFSRCGLEGAEHRPIDLLDVEAAILNRFHRAGDLHQLARGDFRVGIGPLIDEFHTFGLQ